MKFSWTTIGVADMARSLAFYRDVVGLSVTRTLKPGPDMEIFFLGDGETQVELIHNTRIDKVNPGDNISLGFEVFSLEQTKDFLKKKGVAIHSGPFQPNPHIRFLYVLDPDGLRIQFLEHVTPTADKGAL